MALGQQKTKQRLAVVAVAAAYMSTTVLFAMGLIVYPAGMFAVVIPGPSVVVPDDDLRTLARR
jgi:hypothetical protein